MRRRNCYGRDCSCAWVLNACIEEIGWWCSADLRYYIQCNVARIDVYIKQLNFNILFDQDLFVIQVGQLSILCIFLYIYIYSYMKWK